MSQHVLSSFHVLITAPWLVAPGLPSQILHPHLAEAGLSLSQRMADLTSASVNWVLQSKGPAAAHEWMNRRGTADVEPFTFLSNPICLFPCMFRCYSGPPLVPLPHQAFTTQHCPLQLTLLLRRRERRKKMPGGKHQDKPPHPSCNNNKKRKRTPRMTCLRHLPSTQPSGPCRCLPLPSQAMQPRQQRAQKTRKEGSAAHSISA